MRLHRIESPAKGGSTKSPDINAVVSLQAPVRSTTQSASAWSSAQRQRLTGCSERKIDSIGQQLARISRTLETVAQSQQSAQHSTQTSTPSTPRTTFTSIESVSSFSTAEVGNESVVEGASTVAAHATLASKYLGASVERNLNPSITSNIHTALKSLDRLLDGQDGRPTSEQSQFAHQKPLGPGGFRSLPVPSSTVVLSILRKIKQRPPIIFNLICCLQGTDYFTDQCRRVYFATEDFSQATFIIVNAGLYYLLQEKIALDTLAGNQDEVATNQEYQNMCRDNLETSLANLPLILSAQRQNVEALVLGASYAIDICRPSIAWQLNVKACEMSVLLGYHRSSSQGSSADNARGEGRVLFWFVYMFDKALALRLGCSSILQDYDITIPRRLQPFSEFDEHRDIIESWITYAEVQGKIYEGLYSPLALRLPLASRIGTARTCIHMLQERLQRLSQQRTRRERIPGREQDGREIIRLFLVKSEEVGVYSTLTLVYRALPSSSMDGGTGNSVHSGEECIHCARETLQRHNECVEMIQRNPMLAAVYMHW